MFSVVEIQAFPVEFAALHGRACGAGRHPADVTQWLDIAVPLWLN